MKYRPKRSFAEAVALGLFGLCVLLSSCDDLFSQLDNPVDPEAANYQGYRTVPDLDGFSIVYPGAGGRLTGMELRVTLVRGASAYALRIAASAQALGATDIYEKNDYAANMLDISAAPISDRTAYWWQSRAMKDGSWGEWTAGAEFTTDWSANPAAIPTFSPEGGTYAGDQSVTMRCATAGATIYYTTDGSAPTTSSSRYAEAIVVAGHGTAMTIRAMALAKGHSSSGVGGASYRIEYDAASTPTFNPLGATYTGDQAVTISCATEGASIYYTTDGSDPTTSSTRYAGAIGVAGHGTTMTIKAIAMKDGYLASSVGSAGYTISYPSASTPRFNLLSGEYGEDKEITISCDTAGSSIYYTLDGSEPSASSLVYAGPIPLAGGNARLDIRAIAMATGYLRSAEGTGNFYRCFALRERGPAGGFIFYDKGNYSDDWRYLEAAPSDLTTGLNWERDYQKKNVGDTPYGIGEGRANTASIIASFGDGDYAASACDKLEVNGFSDWFLPSRDELYQMYRNLKYNDVGGFSDAVYWSSSTSGIWYTNNSLSGYYWSIYKYCRSFSTGSEDSENFNYNEVRAIRAF